MTMMAVAFPILPGKTEEWRRFLGEINTSRKAEFDASRQRYGVQEHTYLQQTPNGDVVIVTLTGDDPLQAFIEWAQGDDEFTRWFVSKVQEIHGVDISSPLPGPMPELIAQSPPLDAGERNMAVVQDAYEAFARQDIPAVMAALDPDIEWYAPEELPIGGTFRGHDGALQFFGGLPRYFEDLHVEPQHFVASGDRVVAIGHHHGRVNGRPFDIGFAMEWTLRDGRCIRFREYNDSGKLLQIAAAGLKEGTASGA